MDVIKEAEKMLKSMHIESQKEVVKKLIQEVKRLQWLNEVYEDDRK